MASNVVMCVFVRGSLYVCICIYDSPVCFVLFCFCVHLDLALPFVRRLLVFSSCCFSLYILNHLFFSNYFCNVSDIFICIQQQPELFTFIISILNWLLFSFSWQKESSDLAVTTSAEEISIFGITTLHSWPNLNYQQFEESTGISTSKAHTVKSG